MADLVLPAFKLDCRDWVVTDPAELAADGGLAGEAEDVPVLAQLGTAYIDGGGMHAASGQITVGLLDLDELLTLRPLAAGCVTLELIDEIVPGARQFVMPAPTQQLALLAEFTFPPEVEELDRRIEALMRSFRWQA